MRPITRTTIRVIDLIAGGLWVLTVGLLVVATLLMTSADGESAVPHDLLVMWSLVMGKMAVGATIISAASWIVRQFEDSFKIAQNVEDIHNELEAMRERRTHRDRDHG